MLTGKQFVAIHRALHEGALVVVIDGKEHPLIKPPGKNYRTIEFEGFRFYKQNTAKNTKYAKRARAGERITWGIRDGSKEAWAYMEGNEGEELTNLENIKQ